MFFRRLFQRNSQTKLWILGVFVCTALISGPTFAATYWNVFNIEGESSLGADIVYYSSFQDMLNDENRQGVGQTAGFGGGFNANIVGSGAFVMPPLSAVPLPASLPMLLTAIGGVFALRKARQR